MFRDRTGNLNDRGLLESIGTDHAAGDLSGNSNERDAVEEGVGETGNEVGGAGTRGGDADAGAAGGAGVAFGGEDLALLVAEQVVNDGR